MAPNGGSDERHRAVSRPQALGGTRLDAGGFGGGTRHDVVEAVKQKNRAGRRTTLPAVMRSFRPGLGAEQGRGGDRCGR